MESKKIIVPVDFTTASGKAIALAMVIAKRAHCSITIFHVLNNDSPLKRKTEPSEVEDKLQALADKVGNEGINCQTVIANGNIFDEIPAIANQPENYMLVIGTHGVHGIKQILLGADILNIVRHISIPCMIVQEDFVYEKLNPIVFPVGAHSGFRQLIDATAMMARLFDAEVHIYSVSRVGEQMSDKIKQNILLAEQVFDEKSITYKRVKDDSTIVSVGYAKQTIQYANSVGAGMIAIMSVKSAEHYYFAQADKENMINNPHNIPVMCLNGIENY